MIAFVSAINCRSNSFVPEHSLYTAGGDSTWEKVSNLAESGEDTPSAKDDYASLTAQLAAGPAAGTRAKSRRPAAVRLPLLCSTATIICPLAVLLRKWSLSLLMELSHPC